MIVIDILLGIVNAAGNGNVGTFTTVDAADLVVSTVILILLVSVMLFLCCCCQ